MKNITSRGTYGQIPLSSLNKNTRKRIENLFEEACASDKIDEHGNWDFSAEFDRHGRGVAMNWDLYGHGRDCHSKRLLVVVQVRQWAKRFKNGFADVRKSYFLIGRNEDDSTFAHPINAQVIHNAIRKDKNVVRACQDWMFGGDYATLQRQGDIALMPLKSKAILRQAEVMYGNTLTLQDSHELQAEQIMQLGEMLYAKNPFLAHLPETHPDIAGGGWWKVIVSKRGRFHDFAAPTID